MSLSLKAGERREGERDEKYVYSSGKKIINPIPKYGNGDSSQDLGRYQE